MEDDIMRRKLLIDGEGTGDDRRIRVLLKSFLKWSSDPPSVTEEEDHLNLQRLMGLIKNCEHASAKSMYSQLTDNQEISEYEAVQCEMQQQVLQAQEDVSSLKQALSEAQAKRLLKQACNQQCEVLSDLPTRTKILDAIRQTDSDYDQLVQLREKLDEAIRERKAQLGSLATKANDLNTLANDEKLDDLFTQFRCILDQDEHVELNAIPSVAMEAEGPPVLTKDTYPISQ